MAFASGKKAYGISDRSGFRYRLKDMRKEWNGLLVGKDEFEAKHPQLRSPRVGADPQALRDPRPETGLAEQRALQYGFNPVGFKTIPGIIEENDLIATGGVGTVTICFYLKHWAHKRLAQLVVLTSQVLPAVGKQYPSSYRFGCYWWRSVCITIYQCHNVLRYCC